MPIADDRLTPQQRRERDVRRQALAAVLKAARTERGWTQAQFAERAGLSRHAILRLEAGTATISVDALFQIAAALGTTPSALLSAVEADPAAAETLKP
ncbi:helix-turn-helix domain-containing protein [Gordonia sp. VNK21]|uniref:helix-turn-helix domain-containing protein n=1 Tax=Gordonia sp. VNK21 TaxID=3382483 RepID=UPI0038D356F1